METDDQIVEALAAGLEGDAYVCTRVWEAWQHNTMSEEDFSPAWEDENLLAGVAAGIEPLIRARVAEAWDEGRNCGVADSTQVSGWDGALEYQRPTLKPNPYRTEATL